MRKCIFEKQNKQKSSQKHSIIIIYPFTLCNINMIQKHTEEISDSESEQTLHNFDQEEQITYEECKSKIFDKSLISGIRQSSIFQIEEKKQSVYRKSQFIKSFNSLFKPLQVYRKDRLSLKTFRQSLPQPGKEIKTFQDLKLATQNKNVLLCKFMIQNKFLKFKELLSNPYLSIFINVNFSFVDNWRLIHFICYHNKKIYLELLLQYYPELDIYAQTNLKVTPFHLSARQGNAQILEILIRHAVHIKRHLKLNLKDRFGNTPLHYSFKHNSKQSSQILLKYGADPFIKNSFGLQPIEMCTQKEVFELITKVKSNQRIKENLNHLSELKTRLKTQLTAASQFQQQRKKKKRINKFKYYLLNIPNFVSLSDFQKIKDLGSGSFGKVVLVQKINRISQQPKLYAMKIINCQSLRKLGKQMKMDLFKWLKIQRKILSLSYHPFLVKLYYAIFTGKKYYLVMDYAQFGTLQRMIESSQWKNYSVLNRVNYAKLYACQLILALQYLKQQHISHRDLKTENIVLKSDGHIKLIDFGLCSYNQIMTTNVGPGRLKAPQIVSGQGGYTYRCDMFYLGIILYKMIHLENPFKTLFDDQQLVNQYKQYDEEGRIRKKIQFDAAIDLDCKRFLQKLLKIRPHNRFLSYQQMKQQKWFTSIDWHDVYQKKLKVCKIKPISSVIQRSSQYRSVLQQYKQWEQEVENALIPSEYLEEPQGPEQSYY